MEDFEQVQELLAEAKIIAQQRYLLNKKLRGITGEVADSEAALVHNDARIFFLTSFA